MRKIRLESVEGVIVVFWLRKLVVWLVSVLTLTIGLPFLGLHWVSHCVIKWLTLMLERLIIWRDAAQGGA